MHYGAVPQHQPCLLLWFLTMDHAVGVAPHYRPCLLVSCHCNQHFTSRVQMEEGWLQFWCYLYRGAIISDMSDDPVPLSDMPACTMQLYQTCMLGSRIHLRMFVKCCSIKQGIWSVTNPSDMPTGRMQLPQGYKTCPVPIWKPSWIHQILNDVLIASLGCYTENVCSSKITIIKFCMQFLWANQS